eukprot:3648345-Karenia_brevis.AAC.1
MNHPTCLVFHPGPGGHQDEHQDESERKGEREREREKVLLESQDETGMKKLETKKKSRMEPG